MTDTQPQRPRSSPRGRLDDLDTAFTPAPAGPDAGPDRASRDLPADAVAVLEIRRGPDAGQQFILNPGSVIVLGRDPRCDVVLPNVTVSRRHAEIRPGPDGFTLADTGSLNGSYLNGQPVDTALLNHGDDVAIGVFRLTFRTGDPAHAAAGRSVHGASPRTVEVGCGAV
jgi:pSer/pThr/pTyr-binding forkhead associated (FHA) protein